MSVSLMVDGYKVEDDSSYTTYLCFTLLCSVQCYWTVSQSKRGSAVVTLLLFLSVFLSFCWDVWFSSPRWNPLIRTVFWFEIGKMSLWILIKSRVMEDPPAVLLFRLILVVNYLRGLPNALRHGLHYHRDIFDSREVLIHLWNTQLEAPPDMLDAVEADSFQQDVLKECGAHPTLHYLKRTRQLNLSTVNFWAVNRLLEFVPESEEVLEDEESCTICHDTQPDVTLGCCVNARYCGRCFWMTSKARSRRCSFCRSAILLHKISLISS